jgi:hypothetical protein
MNYKERKPHLGQETEAKYVYSVTPLTVEYLDLCKTGMQ